MKILITVSVAQRGHVSHPEMIGKCTDQAHSLFEAEFDLEAQSIDTNDLDGTQGGIGTHQEASPPGGMNDGHKTDEQHRLGPDTRIWDGRCDGCCWLVRLLRQSAWQFRHPHPSTMGGG